MDLQPAVSCSLPISCFVDPQLTDQDKMLLNTVQTSHAAAVNKPSFTHPRRDVAACAICETAAVPTAAPFATHATTSVCGFMPSPPPWFPYVVFAALAAASPSSLGWATALFAAVVQAAVCKPMLIYFGVDRGTTSEFPTATPHNIRQQRNYAIAN
jgi:hypothetical protein